MERNMEVSPKTVVTFCNGSSVTPCPLFIRAIVRNCRFQIFAIFCMVLFVLMRPYRAHAELDKWQSVSIIFSMGVVVFALYFLFLSLTGKFGGRLGIRSVHTIWMVLLTSFIATFLGEWSVSLFDGPRLPVRETTFLWVFHFAIFLGLEVVFGIFVLPDVIRHVTQPEPAEVFALQPPVQALAEVLPLEPLVPEGGETASDMCVITVSDKRFLAQCIRSVSSQEHYIAISTFKGEKYFLRGRIRDFLEQIPDEFGYCIHRSHWVSWSGIERVNVANDNMLVYLDDDTLLPVARGRRSDFIERWNRRLSIG
ncbi:MULTISPECIES: LytTR family DNA-binding domain-containing protein [Paracoccus]|uniref:LytTR family DNA-binding domain-containing protein n=1 Tax=Paracoccus TaxID=265 RepID=UPI00258F2639|nr:LytTR family DNA-binding domain-containing protein [Paracoccus sp. (in: a-proteobacteria)]